ncbi:unnamed protein product [Microthlaspi erraticum]|uniref:Zinc knuckle CX2CX4HX4C domain-containing protein n=1 Tax=Microthlaspi erraticum TaxID=1685480 RepID=A0A6D2I6V5_9BRAS|nr:unnamed protein product [Microthlaspi erraticum]
MVIIQRWKPIISPLFPSQIPFWIRLRGLPLHYWKEELLRNIGKELGSLIDHEVSKEEAKIHVSINALEPLVKETIIEFAYGEEALVTLEYERLGFHCSICKKLSHISRDCKEISESKEIAIQNEKYREREATGGRPERREEGTRGDRGRAHDFSQRKDRYGQTYGERGHYSNYGRKRPRDMSVESSTHRNAWTNRETRANERHHQYWERESSNGGERRDMRDYLRRKNTGYERNSQDGLQWREKTRERETRQGSIPTREGNSDFQTPPRQVTPQQLPGVPKTGAVMEELREVTIQYVNVSDPVESAASQQRVNQSEEMGLMETTAANIVAAATESYYRALNFSQEEQNPAQGESVEIGEEVPDTEQVQKKRRGRPPKNKRNSPMVGTSLRIRRFTQIQNSPHPRPKQARATASNTAGPSRRTHQTKGRMQREQADNNQWARSYRL